MLERIALLVGLPPTAPHLQQALTHPSYANERQSAADNQRLEFLGDAVLGFCASERLFERFPDADEGLLTRLRAQLVNADALASWGRDNALSGALRLGRGAEANQLRDSTNVLADAVEALVAAAYLDAGLEVARQVCVRIVDSGLAAMGTDGLRDAKSALQERVQAWGGQTPSYQVIASEGPAHARWFEVAVVVGSRRLASAKGRSKRQAERAAAEAALASSQLEAELQSAASERGTASLQQRPGLQQVTETAEQLTLPPERATQPPERATQPPESASDPEAAGAPTLPPERTSDPDPRGPWTQ